MSQQGLAKVTGFLALLAKAAPQLMLYTQSTFTLSQGPADKWDSLVTISAEVEDNLRWVATNICAIQGAPLWHPSQVTVITSNAAKSCGWGGFFSKMNLTACGLHWLEEQEEDIHVLELRAVCQTLKVFAPHLHRCQVECRMDSTVALSYLVQGGGSIPAMTQIAHQVHLVLASMQASLYTTVWIKGSLNIEADMASRWVNYNNLGLGQHMAVPGPSGACEPAHSQWRMQAHIMEGSQFQAWRP
jgi:hypothetical protein